MSGPGSPAGRAEPPVTPTSAPFWDATRHGRYLLQWCTDCDRPVFYPREFCPQCGGFSLEWRPASGRGTVHTFTVDHKGHPAIGGGAPFVIALVELDEGVRVMTNVVGCEPAAVRVGLPVEVTWEPLSDGRQLPLFTPIEEALT
jgi:uncharacterized OB-fold protein